MKKRMHVFFSGMVQGIGFRFTAEDLAGETDVFGWVKNLKDGRVEIVAEAFEESLKEYLDKLKARFSRNISDVEVLWEEATNEFEAFEIKFDY